MERCGRGCTFVSSAVRRWRRAISYLHLANSFRGHSQVGWSFSLFRINAAAEHSTSSLYYSPHATKNGSEELDQTTELDRRFP
jgi:hypothetical protein